MTNELPFFEVLCGFNFKNNLYMRPLWLKGMPSGFFIANWPFSSIKIYKDRIDFIAFPKDKYISINLKFIVSVQNYFFGTVLFINDPALPKYVSLSTFSYLLPNLLYGKIREVSEKYNLGIKFT